MMKLMKLPIVFLVLLLSLNTFAFNRENCGNLFPKFEESHPPYASPLYVTTMIPSTASYFSSTGHCSMYDSGSSSVARALFLKDNFEALAFDAARGHGESLQALAQLYGCSYESFGSMAKNHYREFFKIGIDPLQREQVIREEIEQDPAEVQCQTQS